jgi:hypothetical protein
MLANLAQVAKEQGPRKASAGNQHQSALSFSFRPAHLQENDGETSNRRQEDQETLVTLFLSHICYEFRSRRFMSSALTTAASPTRVPDTVRRSFPGFTPVRIIILIVILAIVVRVAVLRRSQAWPFSERAVLDDLAEASDSTVTASTFHQTYFPVPGCVLENLEFRHGTRKFTLITIKKLIVKGSYLGILTRHVPQLIVEGGHVFVPPFGSNVTFHSRHSNIVVEEIVANGSLVDFASNDPQKQALRFDVHQALLRNVRWGSPIDYDLTFHNPEPPGEIATHGKFGGWTTGHPGDTPISGQYIYSGADLGVYGGIAGILASKGKFGGVLKHIDIAGETHVPDFEATSGSHKVKLVTKFDAYVDGTHGDTFLRRVNAQLVRTNLIVQGSVAGAKGRKGKAALLDIYSRQGRIEDILTLFTNEPRAPMSGAIALKAKAEIPPGHEPFLEKVRLQGTFGIDEGTFSKEETQRNVDELSAGARGENKDDPETVLTDLKGQVVLENGIARFSGLSFGIPGAFAKMHGTYNILNHKIDLHGSLRVDTKISKTATGMKALFLKMIDPFFKKKRKGEIVPVHIAGTYEKPEFGLDLMNSEDKKSAAK